MHVKIETTASFMTFLIDFKIFFIFIFVTFYILQELPKVDRQRSKKGLYQVYYFAFKDFCQDKQYPYFLSILNSMKTYLFKQSWSKS